MNVGNCYQLGEVLKTHGLKGEVVIHLDVDNPADYKDLESVFARQSGKLVPFFVSSVRLQGDKARIKFDDIDDQNSAKELVGAEIYLPLEMLPDLGKEAYYFHEIVGYSILLEKETLGQLTEIYDQKPNLMFSFDYKGKEVLVPFQDQFVLKVDKVAKQIHINLPDGYLAVYLED